MRASGQTGRPRRHQRAPQATTLAAVGVVLLVASSAAAFTPRTEVDLSEPSDALVNVLGLDTCLLSDLNVTLDDPPDKSYAAGDHAIQWTTETTVSDTDAGLWVHPKGGSWQEIDEKIADDGSYTWDTANVSDGEAWMYTWVRDKVTDCYQYDWNNHSFIVDNTPPELLAFVEPTSSTVWTGSQDILWDREELTPDVAKIEVSADGGTTWSTLVSGTSDDKMYTWDTTAHADGTTYKLRLTLTDRTDHVASVTSSTFALDHTAPVSDLSAPAEGDVVGGTVDVAWTTDDVHPAVVEAQRSDDGGDTWSTVASTIDDDGSYTWNASALADGNWSLGLVPTDLAGNTGVREVVNVTVDNTLPEVHPEDPSGGVYADTVPLVWSTDDVHPDSVHLSHRRRGTSTWTTIVASTPDDGAYNWSVGDLPDDSYEVRIEGTDLAGNRAGNTTATFAIDNTAPDVDVTGPDGVEQLGTIPITWKTDDAHPDRVTVRIQPVGGAWTTVAENMTDDGLLRFDARSLPVGEYQVQVVARDVVDHVGRGLSDTFVLSDPDAGTSGGTTGGGGTDGTGGTAGNGTTGDGDGSGGSPSGDMRFFEVVSAEEAENGTTVRPPDAGLPEVRFRVRDADGNVTVRISSMTEAGLSSAGATPMPDDLEVLGRFDIELVDAAGQPVPDERIAEVGVSLRFSEAEVPDDGEPTWLHWDGTAWEDLVVRERPDPANGTVAYEGTTDGMSPYVFGFRTAGDGGAAGGGPPVIAFGLVHLLVIVAAIGVAGVVIWSASVERR